MKKYSFLLLMVLAVGIFQSCQKEVIDEPGERVAPILPSEEMFIMSFKGFEDLDTSGLKPNIGDDEKDMDSYHNWFFAGSNLIVWNAVLAINMALPVAAFQEAFNHQPVYAGNGVFAWVYDVNVSGDIYFITLTGQFVNGNDVQWQMKASKAGGFSNVTWYTGIVAGDQSFANWTLNHKPNNPEPYISIDFIRDLATNEASIRYTNIIPGDAGNGNYIEYRINADPAFNRAYDVFGGSPDALLEIQWNEPTTEGRVKNPGHYNDSNWHCWDSAKMDVEC